MVGQITIGGCLTWERDSGKLVREVALGTLLLILDVLFGCCLPFIKLNL
jgi:hypothetical protein